jgi:hypothetical protein
MAVDDLVGYVSRFEPHFSHRVEGASTEEVGRLARLVEALTDKALPADYREYLLRMGRKDGGLRPPSNYASMRISSLLEIYGHMVQDGDTKDDLPENCILVAYTGVGLWDVSLEIVGGSESPPRALYTSGKEIKEEAAESFSNLLYHAAFSTFRLPKLPFWATFAPRNPKASLKDFVDAATRAGVVPEKFSDRDVFCGTRGNTCVGMELQGGAAPHVRFASSVRTEIDDLAFEFRGAAEMSLTNRG